jgi:hypothetical protein
VIVLDEVGNDSQVGEGFLVPGFQKKTARITKHTRPQKEGAINFCRILCHGKYSKCGSGGYLTDAGWMRLGVGMLPPLVIGGNFSIGPEPSQNVFPFFTGLQLEAVQVN